ncbi:hypothetical protein [Acinetobacter sp. UC24323]|uniref:hypothetical protein n=1 Tax=Acinetobacter sp. UC24323 TaxID=2839946 RepID=UPI00209EB234|nr:hypothetical protein [Acinetobacter sp. UC24323]MCO9048510.1 hypothetical protein [Acinetobacter sp. UC24323]
MSESIFYNIPKECPNSRYELEFKDIETWLEQDLEFVGNECAQDYFDNHDGWESSWPLEIRVFKDEHSIEPIASLIVEMELEPHFSSSVKAESMEG